MPTSSTVRSQPWSALESDNLTGLQELSEQSLLDAVQERYHQNLIYTDVGDILVAVNPFQSLPIYDNSWTQAYSRPDLSSLAPHIYRVAARAFNSMVQGKKDQVCVISGESGAGKTESAKLIMHQVMEMCRSAGFGKKLRQQITQLNPLLEAFGNAKTALNDNSSRFGKYIQLVFAPNGRIVGAGLEQYLLEKSRVVVQGNAERNFHIFYYMYAGLAPEMLEQLHLRNPTEHRYLRSYHDIMEDCSSPDSKSAFSTVMESMTNMGFSKEEIRDILTLLAGIILIGDIEFIGADGGEDNAVVKNMAAAETVSKILQLESCEDLCFALTTLRTETRGEAVDKRYTCTKAADVRDALAKALYSKMFQWIVSRLNSTLQPDMSDEYLNIGILDIFGFENFDENSFEQFCINLANEQLQCYFNHQIFAMEKIELSKEGIAGLEISFTDNKPVLDLYLTRPIGLLSLLDEQCRGFNGTEKAFIQRSKESFAKHSHFLPDKGNALIFTVRHYAGDVEYTIKGFLEKNKDSLPDTLVTAVRLCSHKLIRTVLLRPANSNSHLRKSIMRKSQRSVMRAMSRRRKSFRKPNKPGGQRRIVTVSAHFRQSLEELMERVFAASPHFVRCIKPNMTKKPRKCEDDFMVKQLRYTGMLEAVRVRREGFAYRPFFSDFFTSFRSLAYKFTDQKVKGTEAACHVILDKAGIDGWKLGKSRVFLRYYHEEKLQLLLKNMDDKATLIQKVFRGCCTRKWTKPLRETQGKQKALMTSFLSTMNMHGKECVPQLIALNTTDIKLAVERFGHRRKVAATADNYKGLTDSVRKVKKAQRFGVQVVPSFAPAAVKSEQKTKHVSHSSSVSDSNSDSESESNPETESESDSAVEDANVGQTHSRNLVSQHNGTEVATTPHFTIPVGGDNSPPNVMVSTVSPVHHTETKTSNKPVPKPRRSPNASPQQSPHHSPTPLPRHNTPSQSPQQSPTPSPKHRKLSPYHSPTPSPRHHLHKSTTHSKQETQPQNLPNGKTHPNPLPFNFPPPPKGPPPKLDPSNGSFENQNRASFRKRLQSRDSEEISLDFSPSQQSLSNGSTPAHERSRSNSDDVIVEPSMASNLVNLRILANSLGNLTEEEFRERVDSNSSASSSRSSRDSFSDQPPQADKRLSSGPRGFGFGKRRARIGSSSSCGSDVASSPSHTSTSQLVIASESDCDVLGFYPHLSGDKSTDMILGQPRGTYVIYKEDSKIYSDEPNLEPSFVLAVSLGRSVQIYPVFCNSSANSSSGVFFHVESTGSPSRHPHLKALVEHFRSNELSPGLRLQQPKLLNGVFVTGPSLKPPSKNFFSRQRNARLAFRRKS